MTQRECADMAAELLASYGSRAFEISLPDKQSCELMRATFTELGRSTGAADELFVVKVFASVNKDFGS